MTSGLFPISAEQERTLNDGKDYFPIGDVQSRIYVILMSKGMARYVDPRFVEAWMVHGFAPLSLESSRASLLKLSADEFHDEVNKGTHNWLFDRGGVTQTICERYGI